MIENDRKSVEMDGKSTRICGKTIEIVENLLQRFRMEGGAKIHPKLFWYEISAFPQDSCPNCDMSSCMITLVAINTR